MKMPPRVITPFALVVLAATVFSVRAHAQSAGYLTTNNLTGVVPGNTYQFGSIDNINVGTGAVNLLIPLYSRPGRKITDTGFYMYSSKFWIVQPNYDPFNPTILDSISWIPSMPNTPNGIMSGTPGGYLNYQEQNIFCVVRSQDIQQNVDSNFTYTDGMGATYQFPNRHVWNSDGSNPNNWRCPGVNITDYDVTSSSTGALRMDTTNFPTSATVTLKNGVRMNLAIGGPANIKVEDTNGNFESVSGGDTLLRTITVTPSQVSMKDSNGNTVNYTMQTGSSGNLSTQFPSSACGSAYFIQYDWGVYEPSGLTLPNGWTYTFTYDPNYGDITKVTLPSGGYIRYDYTILEAVDPGPPWFASCLLDSRRVAHRYVSSTGSPSDEKVWAYTYSGGNQEVTTVMDPNGNKTVHTFDVVGRSEEDTTQYYEGTSTLLKTVNNTWASDYGPVQGNQSIVPTSDYMNWRITQTSTTLNDTGQVSELQTTYDSYTYGTPYAGCGSGGCTASYMNPTEVRTYDYGSGGAGNLLQRTDFTYLYSNSTYANLHMMNQLTSKTVYDSTGNTCHGSSHPCSQTTYEYDNYTGGIAASGAVQHDSAFGTGYTTRGNLTATENWRSSDGSWLTTRNQYDDAGNVLSSSNPNGHSTGYGYSDSWANTSCVPSGGNAAAYLTAITNALNQVTSYKYNSCQGTTASTTDANSETTTFAYDGMNRITQESFPDGGQSTYAYNDPSLPLSITSTELLCNGGSNCPAQHRTITTILDGLGRTSESQLTSITPPVYADTYYDGVGNVSEVTNPYYYNSPSSTDGNTQYLYDVLGRVTQVTAQDGNVTTTTYSGNCATTTDPVGAARKACSDGLGRTTQVFEDPLNSNYETDYSYDALDNLLQVQQKGGMSQPSWRTRTFAYDSVSELLCSSNSEIGTTPTTPCPIPDGGSYTAGTTRYSYDYDGNVLSKISPAPNQTNANTTVTLSYSYDNLDRLLQKMSSDGTIGSYYLYDTADTNGVVLLNPIGRLSRSNTSVVESLHSYDAMGRVLEDMQTTPMHNQMAFLLTYTYDFIGDMTSYTNGMGYSFTQSFDGAARLTNGVTTNYSNSPSPIASNFMYVPTGAMTTMSLNNSNYAETRIYNNRLEPTEAWTYIPPDNTIEGNWLGYQNPSGKNNGNVYGWTFYSNYQGITAERSFTYDSLNRLSSMSSPGDTSGCYGLNWTYDPWGNRKTQTTTPGTGGSCPNFSASFSQNTNRMDDYSYDVAGNLLNDGSHSYTYDAENHLIKVDGGATATYTYDADGRRVETTNSEGTLEKIYDLSGHVIADWNATGQMQGGWWAGYVYLFGRLAAVYEGGTIYFVGTDHLGSARALANSNGTIVDALNLLPFGEQLQGDTYTTHKFTGYERDTETSLDNAQARYYGSSMGRFMSPDSIGGDIGNPQSLNRYAYVFNNPLIFSDPTGHDCVYLNNAGTGVDPGDPNSQIDTNSNAQECADNQGVWFNGTVDTNSIKIDPNSDWVEAQNTSGVLQAACNSDQCSQSSLLSFVGAPSNPIIVNGNGPNNPGALLSASSFADTVNYFKQLGFTESPFDWFDSYHPGQLDLRDNNPSCSMHVAINQGSGQAAGEPARGDAHIDTVNPWWTFPALNGAGPMPWATVPLQALGHLVYDVRTQTKVPSSEVCH